MSEKTSELEKLKGRLFGGPGVGAQNVKIFRGSEDASPEEIASQMNKAIDQIAAGDYEEINDFDD